MLNVFEQRATEYLQDKEAFVAAVTPAPLITYLKPHAENLFNRLVLVTGTPGSGKTTVAKLVEFETIFTLLELTGDLPFQADTIAALSDCGFLDEVQQLKLAVRIPFSASYRDFWELPYEDNLKDGLLRSMIQSRTCIAWIQALHAAGYQDEDIELELLPGTAAAASAIGAESVRALYLQAQEVEKAIYDVTGRLIPPPVESLSPEATQPYRPFDVIRAFHVRKETSVLRLQPLIILDDAHELHSDQFQAIENWLMSRDLPVARWVMTRLDALTPDRALQRVANQADQSRPGTDLKREIVEIHFQSTDMKRRESRKTFRKMASDMSNRYLSLMNLFSTRGYTRLQELLLTTHPALTKGRSEQLQDQVTRDLRKLSIGGDMEGQLRENVAQYARNVDRIDSDVELAMYRILIHRYAVRNPGQDLFEPRPSEASVPSSNRGVEQGARIHLMHDYQFPYYYGLEAICDIGSENAELFLQITSRLVEHIQARLVRNRPSALSPGDQHRLLREKATAIVDAWSFPESDHVRALVEEIGRLSLARTLEPNAPLGAGANAVGVPQSDFDKLVIERPHFAKVLQYAVAYKAIVLVPRYKVKHRLWCLLELGGPAIAHFGLPMNRGGFVETTLPKMIKASGAD